MCGTFRVFRRISIDDDNDIEKRVFLENSRKMCLNIMFINTYNHPESS